MGFAVKGEGGGFGGVADDGGSHSGLARCRTVDAHAMARIGVARCLAWCGGGGHCGVARAVVAAIRRWGLVVGIRRRGEPRHYGVASGCVVAWR